MLLGVGIAIGDPDPDLYSLTDGVVRADNTIPGDVVFEIAGKSPFWSERGKAIQAYASLEQALCFLLSELGNIDRAVAGTIFFKITSAKARNAIIEKLIHKRFGNTYNRFWNSVFKQLTPLDNKRNEIVHWTVKINAKISEARMILVGVSLIPPNFWDGDAPRDVRVTTQDLTKFSEQAETFARLCNMFAMVAGGNMTPEFSRPWLQIFQQPLVYPLPEDHLLFQKPSGLQNLPQPSPG